MTDAIQAEAIRRHERHLNHPTHRPLSVGYELIGLRGEEAFAKMFGGVVDLSARPNGDGGVDNIIKTRHGIFVVDVKAARKAFNLIVEVGKAKPLTIYVLAQYSDATDSATLLGWEWGKSLLAAPTRDFGKGVINHFIPLEKIRFISDLLAEVS